MYLHSAVKLDNIFIEVVITWLQTEIVTFSGKGITLKIKQRGSHIYKLFL